MPIQKTLDAAIAHHYAGRLREAETLYRQILTQQPDNTDVIHRLGILAGQMNHHDVALKLLHRLVALQPDFYGAHYSLGNEQCDNGQFAAAVASYQKSISLNRDYFNAHNNLGNAMRGAGRLQEAVASYRKALAISPDYPPALINLGDALRLTGQLPEAITSLERAVALSPNSPAAHNLLGLALHAAGRLDEAIAYYRQGLAMVPDDPQALNNLASALREKGLLDEAIVHYQRAVAIDPRFPDAHCNLGTVLRDRRQVDEAIVQYRRAVSINPEFAEAHNDLGDLLRDQGQIDEAITCCQRALSLNPDLAGAKANLAKALAESGRIEEAVELFRQMVAGNVKEAAAHSSLIYSLHFHPDYDSQAILREHLLWDQRHARQYKPSIPSHANDRLPHRQLRVGYISSDFRKHVVGWNMLPLLREHDHSQLKIFCYAKNTRPDDFTDRLRAHVDVWRDILAMNDEQVAQLIRDDGIDILVDLSLHTLGNHLLVFARKPAPVQVTYLGYCSTTGMEAMDYRFSDPYMDPLDVNLACYAEKTIRLPQTFWCYQPGGPTPDVSPLPALTAGHITFGCLNNFMKVSANVLELWAEILQQVPGSSLLLSSKWGSHRQATADRFVRHGISADRIHFVGFNAWDVYIRQYDRIDIALDPFPYNGGITSCDSLWMGVPLVSLSGRTAVGRAGRSILSNVGLRELIAADPPEYVRIAVELASDLPRLSQLRSTLRDKMQHSPLTDAQHFARNVESAYRQMWRIWCATG